MSLVKIFCEGVTDQIFLADCIEKLYQVETKRTPNKADCNQIKISFNNEQGEIIGVGGCSRLTNELFLQVMKETTELGGGNYVIFDADFPLNNSGDKSNTGNKGFDSCKQKLEDIRKRHNVRFEYLIWPNNKDNGEIEDLLRKLIPVNKEPIYNCIEQHQICLRTLEIENLRFAELKEKIGFYLYASLKDSRSTLRDYKDPNYWNLDFDNIDGLSRLKQFLDSIFKKSQVV